MQQHTEVGIFDAKMHLSALVERASHGETIIITKHGHPMATLMSYTAPTHSEFNTILDSIDQIRASSKKDPEGETIQALLASGRNRHDPSQDSAC